MGEGVAVREGGRGFLHSLAWRDVVEISRVAHSVLVGNSAVAERSTFDDDSEGEGRRELIVVESSTRGVRTSSTTNGQHDCLLNANSIRTSGRRGVAARYRFGDKK